jgi:hypothetical protein
MPLLTVALLVTVLWHIPVSVLQDSAPPQTSKRVYIEPDKLHENGAFAISAVTDAEIVLSLRADIAGGGKRVLLGSSFGGGAEVHMKARTPDGKLVWEGKNKYKKGSTLWGAGTDIGCGLANGIVKKFVAEAW